jgi:hypothetical protein
MILQHRHLAELDRKLDNLRTSIDEKFHFDKKINGNQTTEVNEGSSVKRARDLNLWAFVSWVLNRQFTELNQKVDNLGTSIDEKFLQLAKKYGNPVENSLMLV